MYKFKKINYLAVAMLCLVYISCKIPSAIQTPVLKNAPAKFLNSIDSTNSSDISWGAFYNDKNLVSLIDIAVKNNPDVLIALQDIEIAQNKVRMRKGELLPSVTAGGGLGVEKVGRYTSQGAGDASAEIIPGKIVPEHLADFNFGIRTSWEADVWGKLRSAKKAAFAKYLKSIEGKNFVLTNLVAEVANSYYELLSLDNQLDIIRNSIELQKKQLAIVVVQKQAAVATELAVKQFEAQVLNSQSQEYDILQNITEVENKINFLLGRYPQTIVRDKSSFANEISSQVKEGIPSQLLRNRPDIKSAEQELQAAKWDVKVARLAFYPSLGISAKLGAQAFKASFIYQMPESLLYTLAADLAAPIINRNAIIAEFKTANALQIQAMYDYQKTIINGYVEVSNELSNINNLEKMYEFKSKEVDVRTNAIDISNDLYKAARANYLEVLTIQRDALESKLQLVEIKKQQFATVIDVYKALGGGWR
ncbi:MAG: TolC family protein [Chitinophagaceae bacterium]